MMPLTLTYSAEVIHATGTQTNIEMWRDLIGCYGKRGMAKEAYHVLREMEEKYGVLPDHSCWLRVVRAFATGRSPGGEAAAAAAGGGDWRGALETLRAMRSRGVRPSADAWKYVLAACALSPTAPGIVPYMN
jgi:pentatricopeptide repeat protein